MSTNPIISRFPFEAQIAEMPPQHQYVIRNLWNAVADVQGAIPILKSQIGGKTTSSTTPSSSSGGGGTETIILGTNTAGVSSYNGNTGAVTGVSSFNNQSGAISYFPSLGFVNNQTGVTSYTTLPTDAGQEIVFNSSSSIAVTLSTAGTSPGIQLPWFSYISNQGTGTATLTPAPPALINGGSSVSVPGNSFGIIFFDGTNFELLIPVSGGSGVTQLLAGTGISLSPAGGTGVVTVTNTGSTSYSLGGAVTSANVTLGPGAGTGATIVTVMGLDGSHYVEIHAGTGCVAGGTIYTLVFSVSRGHNVFPVVQTATVLYTSFAQVPGIGGLLASTYYELLASGVALSDGNYYAWNVSCP